MKSSTGGSLNSQIASLERTIEACVERRDYATAEVQQAQLDKLLAKRNHTNDNRGVAAASRTARDLSKQQCEEEAKLKRRMADKMAKALRDANARLASMRMRHQEEIDALDRKYSDPRFGSLRLSPDVAALIRAENFYVKNHDFKMARAVKGQITARAQNELNAEQNSADHTVQSKMDATIKRQNNEMKIFYENLETLKNKMKKETSIGLQTIQNKYAKLRHDALGKREFAKGVEHMPPTDGSISGVYKELDDGFGQIQKELVEPPPSAAPKSPRGTRSRGVKSPPMSPQSPRSPRNPRVAKAFENSLRRSGYVSTV